MVELLRDVPSWLAALALLLGAVAAALVVHAAVFQLADRVARRRRAGLNTPLVEHTRQPLQAILPLIAVLVVLPLAALPTSVVNALRHTASVALIAAAVWLIMGIVDTLVETLARRYDISRRDNLAARKVQTQLYLLRRIVLVVLSVVAVSLMLMTFPGVQRLGTTLFASAGVAGLVVGIAARSTLANLIAGIQMALTEPIRIDDVVIVEGEWGWIEEIGTTYVVMRIWDLRRLVVPLTYFIEKPFQNWTRVTADLLGTVFVYTDYTVPVQAVRDELLRILEASGLWDGKVWNLQVTNADAHSVELRALMSAPDSPQAWSLRCHVREKLIEFLQREYPASLPRTRAEIHDSVPLGRRSHEREAS